MSDGKCETCRSTDQPNAAIARVSDCFALRAKVYKHGFIGKPTSSGKTLTTVRFVLEQITSPQNALRILWVAA
jgi:hypothetical protein